MKKTQKQKQIDLLKDIKSIMDIVRNEKRFQYYSVTLLFPYYGFDYIMQVSLDCISLYINGFDEINEEITEEEYSCSYKYIKWHIDNEESVEYIENGFNSLYYFLEEVKNDNDLVKKMHDNTKYKLLKDMLLSKLKLMDKKEKLKFMNRNFNKRLKYNTSLHYNTKTLDKLLNII